VKITYDGKEVQKDQAKTPPPPQPQK